MRLAHTVATGLVLAAAAGCPSQTPQAGAGDGSAPPLSRATPLTTAPAVTIYRDPSFGVDVDVPNDWRADPQDRRSQRWDAPTGTAELSLDVPALPFHIPGLLPIGQVEGGYVNDVKSKRLSDGTATELSPPAVPNATVRRVVVAGHDKAGTARREEAVLIVHGDAVYVLGCTADEADYPAAHAALDAAVVSLRWVK